MSSFLDNREVVVKIGEHKLYLDELSELIPNNLSADDSAALAKQYIETWGVNQLLLDLAQKELPQYQKDVSKELEDYKTSLLKFKYEQSYINQRLDTLVTDNEIVSYFDSHKSNFVLERPVVRYRFAQLNKKSPNYDKVVRLMSQESPEDLDVEDSLYYVSALRYGNYEDQFVDINVLAKKFDTDYRNILSNLKNNYIILPVSEGDDNVNVAYIYQIYRKGQIAPISFYRERIIDIIINLRKQKLQKELEQELLKQVQRQIN